MPGTAAQIHLWPWSIGVEGESIDVSEDKTIDFHFYGSPVLSFAEGVNFYLDHRYERFAPFGSHYESVGGTHQVCESPNMDLVPLKLGHKGGFNGQLKLHTSKNESYSVSFQPQGARARFKSDDDKVESFLCRSIIAWSQFYDDIIEESRKQEERSNELSWSFIYKFIKKISTEKNQPRMALIVKISETMHQHLPPTVKSARRVLNRSPEMVPVNRLTEMDRDCIRWLARQPGKNMAEKASHNQQTLRGVARKESFNTLENKILKEFIRRCEDEARRYLKNEVGNDPILKNSKRHKQVLSFQNLCDNLIKDQKFINVKKPSSGARPNYVIQNDIRYRKIWNNYLKILRKENQEDQIWDWQSRTWADVSRLLINVGLFELTKKKEQIQNKINIKELYRSTIRVHQEQHLGSRIIPGSEPGPFFIWKSKGEKSKGYILEVVHPNIMNKHFEANKLGYMGGHLYLVLTPVSGGQKTVIVMWAVHFAASTIKLSGEKIVKSAKEGLDKHKSFLSEGAKNVPFIKGLVMASDLVEDKDEPEFFEDKSNSVAIFQIPVDQRSWINTIEYLMIYIKKQLEEILSE